MRIDIHLSSSILAYLRISCVRSCRFVFTHELWFSVRTISAVSTFEGSENGFSIMVLNHRFVSMLVTTTNSGRICSIMSKRMFFVLQILKQLKVSTEVNSLQGD